MDYTQCQMYFELPAVQCLLLLVRKEQYFSFTEISFHRFFSANTIVLQASSQDLGEGFGGVRCPWEEFSQLRMFLHRYLTLQSYHQRTGSVGSNCKWSFSPLGVSEEEILKR